jgi:Tol biopolymer transport system component
VSKTDGWEETMRTISVAAFVLALLLTGADRAVAQAGHDLFQQALVKERADGDLRGAIAIYERIAREYATDRTLAAKALVQLGRCHEKLGNEDAQRAYRRVVQDYPDQTDMAAEARTRLTALQRLAIQPATSGVIVRQVAHEGSPSPDGRYVAFTDWATGDVAIHDSRSEEDRRLTTTGSQARPNLRFGMDPVISPDGKWVAYEWYDANKHGLYDLRIVPMDGSAPPRVVWDDTTGLYVMMPSWSRDGKHIAAARYPEDETHTDVIWVSVDDGTVRVLATLPSLTGLYGLSHSPDDRYVAYNAEVPAEGDPGDIHIAATDGSGSRPLVQHPADDRLLGWVPGTDWVLFLSDRADMWGAWAVRVVDGRAQGTPQLVHPGMGEAHPRGFSELGDLRYNVGVRWFATHVAPFDVAGGEIDTAHADLLPEMSMRPVWSPDGTKLAFQVERRRGDRYSRPLHVFDVATAEVRELAGHLTVSRPRWSPDGQSVVVSAYDHSVDAPDYHGGIYRVDVATAQAQMLVTLPREPAWWLGLTAAMSSDGASLFYLREGMWERGGEVGHDGLILLRDLNSGNEKELYRDPGLVADVLSVSPDGRRLAFVVVDTSQEGNGRLMLLDVQTEDVRELTLAEDSRGIESVSWTADGQYLTCQQSTEGGTIGWRFAVDGGEPESLWEVPGGWGLVSPDGARIAYETGGVSDRHMVIENLKAVLAGQN